TGRAATSLPTAPTSSARRRSDIAVLPHPKASAEPSLQEPLVNAGQNFQIRKGHPFIDHMHGLAYQSELDHRAVILDKASVGRAARSGKLRPASRHRLYGPR